MLTICNRATDLYQTIAAAHQSFARRGTSATLNAPSDHWAQPHVRFRGEADVNRQARLAESIENDPLQTSGFEICRYAQWPLNPIPRVGNTCSNCIAALVLNAFGEGNATTRFHQSDCWISRRVAADGA
jgi:hypothetical protein